MIFSHFFYFVHFPIEIPIVVEKKLPPWEGKVLEQKQFGSMQNLKFQTLLIKNHPISQVEMHPQKTARMKIQLN